MLHGETHGYAGSQLGQSWLGRVAQLQGLGRQVGEELIHRNGAIKLEWESLLDSIAGKCN